MASRILETIDELNAELAELLPYEEKIKRKKQLINMLCQEAGIALQYPDTDPAATISTAPIGGSISRSRGDEFFNKPLNFCLKQVLEHRKSPMMVEQIYDAMIAGGYQKFPGKKEDALNGLRISLGKSTHTFARIPNGSFGLAEWYGIKKSTKSGDKTDEGDATETENGGEENGVTSDGQKTS